MKKYCPECRRTFWSEARFCLEHGDVLKPYWLDDKYEIVERLGGGGYGDVYRALNVLTGVERAVKVPKPPEIREETKKDRLERFLREGRISCRVENPHVVQIHDAAFCQITDTFFLVMDLVKGVTLTDFLASRPDGLDIAVVRRIFEQLCDGAAAIHKLGIVHRDLKPDNVMLIGSDFNRVKIIDFGIAKDLQQSRSLTRSGTMVGTPLYMAPEQFDPGKEQDARVDVFSLGLILFQMLTGKLPDEMMTRDLRDLERHRMNFSTEMTELRRLAPAHVVDATLEVIHQALQNRRENRHPGAREFLAAFEATLENVPEVVPEGKRVATFGEREVLREFDAKTSPLEAIPAPNVKRERPVGTLVITVAQAGVKLFLDGKLIGVSDADGEIFSVEGVVAGGNIEITGHLAGHESISKWVEVARNRETFVEIALQPKDIEPRPGDVMVGAAGIEFVCVPAGAFMMGTETIWPFFQFEKKFEVPVHRVEFKKPFWMGRFQVTQAQWESVMGNNPSYFQEGGKFPVECVSWEDCQRFIGKLNARGDRNFYHLPSEAEWEYACRAGTVGEYAGDLNAMAWFDNNSGGHTQPVGEKMPNSFGLYDMHGNVWEWCQDNWHENYKGAPSDGSAWESGENNLRMLRGGSWNETSEDCRSALRAKDPSTISSYGLGFRVVATTR